MHPGGALSILVTGAAGEIGSRLVRRLLHAGHRVRALVLPGDPLLARLEETGCDVVPGDITRPETLPGAMAGVHTVYHLAAVLLVEDERLFRAVNVLGTRHVVAAAGAAGVEHLVHVSSASVVYPRATPYSRSKQLGEQAVRAARGLSHTIVRPTLVYDDHGGGLEFALFVDFVTRYPLVPLIGDGRALKNPVHVDDLVSGLAAIAGNPRTHGRIYELCGGEPVSIREMARLVLKRRGLHRPLLPLPLPLCHLGALAVGRLTRRTELMRHTLAGLTQDADLDRTAASRDLGYAPMGFRQGIRRCWRTAADQEGADA